MTTNLDRLTGLVISGIGLSLVLSGANIELWSGDWWKLFVGGYLIINSIIWMIEDMK